MCRSRANASQTAHIAGAQGQLPALEMVHEHPADAGSSEDGGSHLSGASAMWGAVAMGI